MSNVHGTFTDVRDGYIYKTVKLRDGRWWLAENLRFHRAGSCPPDKNPTAAVLATHPQYNHARYGRLYTFDAAQHSTPYGWHVPSDKEWQRVLNVYGGFGPLHGEIRATGRNELATLIVDDMNIEFGGCVTQLPSGSSQEVSYTYFGSFMAGRFWTSSRPFFSRSTGVYYVMYLNDRVPPTGTASWSQENDWNVFSVRCIMD
jgi:uncharacterized protein (TIGR02145 family)